MERANNDLIIFCLVWTSALLLIKRGDITHLFGIVVLFTATILKIFPVAAMFIIPLTAHGMRRFIRDVSAIVLILLIWAVWYGDELRTLYEIVPRPVGRHTFGGAMLLVSLGYPEHKNLIALLLGIITMLLAVQLSRALNVRHSNRFQRETVLFYMGYAILAFTFLANTNYDYRCVFFIFLTPWLVTTYQAGESCEKAKSLSFSCLVLIIFVTWSEAFANDVPRLFSFLTELGGHLPSARVVQDSVRLAEHLLTWLLMFLLAIVFFASFLLEIRPRITGPSMRRLLPFRHWTQSRQVDGLD